MAGIAALVILGGIVAAVIAVVRRRLDKSDGSGDSGDVLVYLLLALAVGTAGFSLAALGRTAFPGDTFVFDTSSQVATALAGLVVAAPIAFFLWRQQAERRETHTSDAGWIVYLALIEAVFLIAFVVAAYQLVSWALGASDSLQWTDVLVFGGRGGLPRVGGSKDAAKRRWVRAAAGRGLCHRADSHGDRCRWNPPLAS